jgi:ankyrin repeat protein
MTEIVNTVIEDKSTLRVNLKQQDHNGMTALHVACDSEQLSKVFALVLSHVDLYSRRHKSVWTDPVGPSRTKFQFCDQL